jgi:hypothetical protein
VRINVGGPVVATLLPTPREPFVPMVVSSLMLWSPLGAASVDGGA